MFGPGVEAHAEEADGLRRVLPHLGQVADAEGAVRFGQGVAGGVSEEGHVRVGGVSFLEALPFLDVIGVEVDPLELVFELGGILDGEPPVIAQAVFGEPAQIRGTDGGVGAEHVAAEGHLGVGVFLQGFDDFVLGVPVRVVAPAEFKINFRKDGHLGQGDDVATGKAPLPEIGKLAAMVESGFLRDVRNGIEIVFDVGPVDLPHVGGAEERGGAVDHPGNVFVAGPVFFSAKVFGGQGDEGVGPLLFIILRVEAFLPDPLFMAQVVEVLCGRFIASMVCEDPAGKPHDEPGGPHVGMLQAEASVAAFIVDQLAAADRTFLTCCNRPLHAQPSRCIPSVECTSVCMSGPS